VPHQAPGLPPSPTTVTRNEPGGDADDPHVAALSRLLSERWGWRNDKQDALHVPMPDWQNWRRIRYYGVPTFVGFRYGDDHHAVLAIWVRPVEEGAEATPDACLESFEKWASPTAHDFDVELAPGSISRVPWQHGEAVIKSVEAEIRTLFSHKQYAAAYGAYRMWPGTCTIFGVAVPVRGAEELARAVRDRYVREGFGQMDQHMTETPQL
jgi:hypothetical protein